MATAASMRSAALDVVHFGHILRRELAAESCRKEMILGVLDVLDVRALLNIRQ